MCVLQSINEWLEKKCPFCDFTYLSGRRELPNTRRSSTWSWKFLFIYLLLSLLFDLRLDSEMTALKIFLSDIIVYAVIKPG